jgi:activating signal cointegrator 1
MPPKFGKPVKAKARTPARGDKVLTIRQPWCDLILGGAKWCENRSWSTKYRGPLWIHAASKVEEDEIRAWREEAGYDFRTESPFGLKTSAIVGRVELVACVPVEDLEDFRAGGTVKSLADVGDHLRKVNDDTWKYVSGPICWLIANVEPCAPVACNGKLGLWIF